MTLKVDETFALDIITPAINVYDLNLAHITRCEILLLLLKLSRISIKPRFYHGPNLIYETKQKFMLTINLNKQHSHEYIINLINCTFLSSYIRSSIL